MKDPFETALIITTYNWPQALKMTLRSVLRQTRKPDELIIADDGSGPETEGAVSEILANSGLVWYHVRHEDKGIRQARIKNLAVKHSHASYLIFIDHDVILHPEFVADHLANVNRKFFLQGKRVFLPEHYTAEVLKDGMNGLPGILLRGLGNRKNAIRSRIIGTLISRPRGFQISLRGCNLSMHRENFLMVDGYDEIFDQFWGREDSDICYRLFHSGLGIKNLWFSALQYHLHHTVIKKKVKDRLDLELQENIREKRKRAIRGFSKLSSEGGLVASFHDF